jgi:catechol 2,3-dioxygenase-like lactoylglutathione lyase family enzyme
MMGKFALTVTLPASDIERAKKWYAEKLGLEPVAEFPGAVRYQAGGVRFEIYPSQFAGTAQNTAAGWNVDDVEKVVDELSARGVVFEQYDFPGLKTNEKGIAQIGPETAAWFKDSEGNTIGVARYEGE